MAFNWRPTTAPVQTRYDDIWFISPEFHEPDRWLGRFNHAAAAVVEDRGRHQIRE
jgi:hypothetical protein